MWDESEPLSYLFIYNMLYRYYMDFTTIQIKKETREKLKTKRIAKRETYDEIINRLIK